MHDTDLFHPAPYNLVQFTNNSIKYRDLDHYHPWGSRDSMPPRALHYAWDNIPGTFPDPKRNLNYPWASDSLTYFWDFGEPDAKRCTSTVNKPNIHCAWSTEVAPKHLYKKMGRYEARLWVSDSLVNRTDVDSVYIVMQKPNIAPDSSYGSSMNYYSHIRLDTSANHEHLGWIFYGKPCVLKEYQKFAKRVRDTFRVDLGHCQTPIVENWWIVTDAEKQCDTFPYRYMYAGHPKDTYRVECNWIPRDSFNKESFFYDSGGWKTVGLVAKIGDSYDTVWYKNYKWVHHIKTAIDTQLTAKGQDSLQLKTNLNILSGSHDSLNTIYFLSSTLKNNSVIKHDSHKVVTPASYNFKFDRQKGLKIQFWGLSGKECYFNQSDDISYSSNIMLNERQYCQNEPVSFDQRIVSLGTRRKARRYFQVPDTPWFKKNHAHDYPYYVSGESRQPSIYYPYKRNFNLFILGHQSQKRLH